MNHLPITINSTSHNDQALNKLNYSRIPTEGNFQNCNQTQTEKKKKSSLISIISFSAFKIDP